MSLPQCLSAITWALRCPCTLAAAAPPHPPRLPPPKVFLLCCLAISPRFLSYNNVLFVQKVNLVPSPFVLHFARLKGGELQEGGGAADDIWGFISTQVCTYAAVAGLIGQALDTYLQKYVPMPTDVTTEWRQQAERQRRQLRANVQKEIEEQKESAALGSTASSTYCAGGKPPQTARRASVTNNELAVQLDGGLHGLADVMTKDIQEVVALAWEHLPARCAAFIANNRLQRGGAARRHLRYPVPHQQAWQSLFDAYDLQRVHGLDDAFAASSNDVPLVLMDDDCVFVDQLLALTVIVFRRGNFSLDIVSDILLLKSREADLYVKASSTLLRARRFSHSHKHEH